MFFDISFAYNIGQKREIRFGWPNAKKEIEIQEKPRHLFMAAARWAEVVIVSKSYMCVCVCMC